MKKTGFNLTKFDNFLAQLSGKKNAPLLRAAFNQWGVRYLAETKKTFVKNSAGGGEWPPLKRRRGFSTVRTHGRKTGSTVNSYKRKNKGGDKILRDTGTLFKALSIGSPGNLYQDLKNGKRVGFGGPSRHPSGQFTIADIAKVHQVGGGHLPKRQILHQPSSGLIQQMLGDLSRAVNRIGGGA
jgi:hypothetical protein